MTGIDGDTEVVELEHKAGVVEDEFHEREKHGECTTDFDTPIGEHGYLGETVSLAAKGFDFVMIDLIHGQSGGRIGDKGDGGDDLLAVKA